MIAIDFQGGAHGNYLEFVCNKIAGVKAAASPFNKQGAAHKKHYFEKKIFVADHYTQSNGQLPSHKVIMIKIEEKDLLALSQISLLRAGDYGYDNNELHINTYHKLNNKDYRWVLDTIIDRFFSGQVKQSYNNVKDDTWPDIETVADFENLPLHIKKECLETHGLTLLELNHTQPHCPKSVLREFFEIGFIEPQMHGFMRQQTQMMYDPLVDLYEFPFGCFYDTDFFIAQIKKVATWAGFIYNDWSSVEVLHQDFLSKQPYKHSKQKCDIIVQQIIQGLPAPAVNLIEESYINAMLTKQGYERRY